MKHPWNEAFRRHCRTIACGCLLAASHTVFAASADLNAVITEAQTHLQNGEPAKAYDLLLARESDFSGQQDYDYLLGIAALDSGEPGESIFSLQRVITRSPDFAGARMDLARAYFEIGDNELARKEFNQVLTENPPANVTAAANQYLEAIDVRARTYQSDIQYSFDFGFGYDSNSPAATADDVFLNFTLSPNNLEQSSAFVNTAFGTVYNKPITAESQILLSARLDHRSNPSTHFVDASNADIGAAYTFNRGNHNLSLSANKIFSWLDREQQKDDTGISVAYTLKLSDGWSLMTFARASEVRFEEAALQVQDVDRLSYGVSLTQTFTSALMSLTVTGGDDDADQTGSPFSTDTVGVSLANTWFRPSGTSYFVQASATKTEYDEQFFGLDREDDVLALALGATWPKFPADDWSTTFKLSFSEKESDVSLYEFDRYEAGFTLQKLF